MAKVKALYQDMVLMEQNMVELDRKAELRAAMLDKRARLNQGFKGSQSSLSSTLKTIVITALLSFSFAMALASDSGFKVLLIVIPVALGMVWAWANYMDRAEARIEHDAPVQLSTGPSPKSCSRDDFIQRCFDVRIDGRDREACEDVIFGKLSVQDAAKKHKMFPAALTRLLIKIDMQQCQE